MKNGRRDISPSENIFLTTTAQARNGASGAERNLLDGSEGDQETVELFQRGFYHLSSDFIVPCSFGQVVALVDISIKSC